MASEDARQAVAAGHALSKPGLKQGRGYSGGGTDKQARSPRSRTTPVAGKPHYAGLMSIRGVPSRQSRSHTVSRVPSTAIRSTIEDAMGFGRIGDRRAKVPLVRPEWLGVCS